VPALPAQDAKAGFAVGLRIGVGGHVAGRIGGPIRSPGSLTGRPRPTLTGFRHYRVPAITVP
jgi:hypothetical protein